MNQNRIANELLSEVHRNLTVGSNNLGNMLPKVKDKFLMQAITCQMEQYSAFTEEAEALMKQEGQKPPKLSAADKLFSRTGAMMNTMFDSSDRHIAHLIAKGTKTGAETLESTIRSPENTHASPTVMDLAQRVTAFERTEADRMKAFT